MNISEAHVLIQGTTPYSQSRQHSEPKFDGEKPDAYDERTWQSKLNLDDDGMIVIPAHGIQQAIIAAAKYSGRQIPGQGKKTWTAKFTSGILINGDARTGLAKDAAKCVALQCSSTGKRGAGSRVLRRFPVIDPWTAEFDVLILDPIVTEDMFHEMLTIAGLLIGLGRFRPENGGSNGRFTVSRLDWKDNRSLAA